MSNKRYVANIVFASVDIDSYLQYRVIRGEMKPGEYIEKMRGENEVDCCANSGFARKIQRQFGRMVDDRQRRECELSLIVAFNTAIICMAQKGSIESITIEQIFSICRMLGLRLCYTKIGHLYSGG